MSSYKEGRKDAGYSELGCFGGELGFKTPPIISPNSVSRKRNLRRDQEFLGTCRFS